MIDFESLGYINITNKNPIHFIECFGETFETVYPYSERFYKQEANITIVLNVGNYYNQYFISGICYHHNGWKKFEVNAHKDDINEMFTQTIKAVKFNINKV